jgi:hypothetical protein
MDTSKKARLEAAGWKVSDYAEFLELSDEVRAEVELRLELIQASTGSQTTEGE